MRRLNLQQQKLFKMFLLSLTTVFISINLSSKLVQGSSDGEHTANELQQCNKTSHGVLVLYNNSKGNDVEVVCLRENMQYRWKFVDGSSTFGERFDPANDCSDIVDNLPKAHDGFFWVTLNTKTPRKVWCDVHSDGGGFMLVGMKDGPTPWKVPSSSIPVYPQGPPHWSSVLGKTEILDFGIQFSSENTFLETKAHWYYRLKRKRQLRHLFTNKESTGCASNDPGIGDVMYVKDVLTQSIATTNFKCSIFGPHTHPNLGWARMNYCLDNDCDNGYGVFPGPIPFQYDQYGSFSYSAISSSSGTERNSTAFVGCDVGKCCACFGPKGGRQAYCGPKCTKINGGKVLKKVFVWFWVRNRVPKRHWKRCMEFTKTNSNGKTEKHFIDAQTGVARKGSCSEQFKVLLNEGTLTVSDKKSFEKIPDVPGLLSYRKDTKQLYVNQGSKWQALDNERELQQLQQEVKNQDIKVLNLENKIQTQANKIKTQENMIRNLKKDQQDLVNRTDMLHPPSCSKLRQKIPSTTSGKYYINPLGLASSPLVQVYCDMTSKNGVGVTVIGHNSESRTYVKGYESAGSYQRKIKYDISMGQIVSIMNQSQYCEQFIKYECFGSVLLYSGSPLYGWWVSRQGSQMNYWGGTTVNSGKCACGMTNSCAGGGTCNCDKNDNVWREDSGYLTDKNTLPVTELRFGDNGDSIEKGYHSLGKLRCWGY